MQVSAINQSNPSFLKKSEYGTFDKTSEDISDVVSIIDTLQKDSYNGKKYQDSDKKSVMDTVLTAAGAIIVPFMAGKALCMNVTKLMPNVTDGIFKKSGEILNVVKGKVSGITLPEKCPKAAKAVFDKTKELAEKGCSIVCNSISKTKNKEQIMGNVAGIAAALMISPEAFKDKNGNGLAAVQDKTESWLGNAEQFGALISKLT